MAEALSYQLVRVLLLNFVCCYLFGVLLLLLVVVRLSDGSAYPLEKYVHPPIGSNSKTTKQKKAKKIQPA